MMMKKCIVLNVMFLASITFWAQSGNLYVAAGKNLSNFLFKVNTETYESLNTKFGSSFTGGYALEIEKNKIGFFGQYYDAGSIADNPDNYWSLSYFGVGADYHRVLLGNDRVSISAGLFGSFNYLLNGSQVLNDQVFNLKKDGVFKTWDILAGPSVMPSLQLNDFSTFFLRYSFAYGINQIEKLDQGEKTHNIINQIGCGLFIKIK